MQNVACELPVHGTPDSFLPRTFDSVRQLAAHDAPKPYATALTSRDPSLRQNYLTAALAHIPRLLGNIDRNPYHATYGCLDRQFWHYRTADFPSEMYQEGVLALALVYSQPLPGNRWQGEPRVRELAIAALRFAARSCHRDGSCDDYYPYERALGASVFSLNAAARAFALLEIDDTQIMSWLRLRAEWIARHDESGRLANHQALAALGLLRVAQLDRSKELLQAGMQRVHKVLSWQSEEGWFDEYGGADPGYQTVTLDSLIQCRRLLSAEWLDEPVRRGVAFARLFLHPDGSYGGEYGSRGTCHFYPHGFELLAATNSDAADLADGFLRSLSNGKQAALDDDRMFAHRLGNLIDAYLDWSPQRAAATSNAVTGRSLCRAVCGTWDLTDDTANDTDRYCEGSRAWHEARPQKMATYLSHAQFFVRRDAECQTIVSLARGGVFKHFSRSSCRLSRSERMSFRGAKGDTGGSHGANLWFAESGDGPRQTGGLPHEASGESPVSEKPVYTDAGLILETTDDRVAVSQFHDKSRRHEVQFCGHDVLRLVVRGPLHWARFETATPLKLVLFRLGLLTVGRWSRTLTRRLLQRRLITARRESPIRLTRTIEFLDAVPESSSGESTPQSRLRVADCIELTSPHVEIRRMSFGTDHQAAYVAACGCYQDSVLQPWIDLAEFVPELNASRSVTIEREL